MQLDLVLVTSKLCDLVLRLKLWLLELQVCMHINDNSPHACQLCILYLETSLVWCVTDDFMGWGLKFFRVQ